MLWHQEKALVLSLLTQTRGANCGNQTAQLYDGVGKDSLGYSQ